MNQVSARTIFLLAGLILALSFIGFSVNNYIYHFPGNDYFPEGIPLLFIILVLFYTGLVLTFNLKSKIREAGKELLFFIGVVSLIALATNAVQLTPFPPIDHRIILFEHRLHIHMDAVLDWTYNHPMLKNILSVIYDSLPYQMSIIPLIVITACRFSLIREYYFLILCTALIGFVFYYFFPTMAPASIINSPFFLPEQIDTGLKFKQIHHHIYPTTNQGGLIALPSFHTIWALLNVYVLKEWTIPCLLLLVINIVLIVSCVLLGWHYVSDIVGGIIVLLISFYLLHRCKNRGMS